MKNKSVIKAILNMMLAITLIVPMMFTKVSAASQYDIIFRAGAHGSLYGENKLVVTKEYGSTFPDEPTLTVDEGYVFAGWSKELPAPGSTVTQKETYVAKYVPIVSGQEYRVRYVDQNDVDIVTPKIALANEGDNVEERAKTINGWPVDALTKSIVITKDKNEIKFVYTVPTDQLQPEYVSEEVINYVDQVTTIPGATVATPATTPTTSNPSNPSQAGGQTSGDTTIDDNQTPLDNGQQNNQEDQTNEEESIDDNETPLAKKDASSLSNVAVISGGILLLLLAYGYLYNKVLKNRKS